MASGYGSAKALGFKEIKETTITNLRTAARPAAHNYMPQESQVSHVDTTLSRRCEVLAQRQWRTPSFVLPGDNAKGDDGITILGVVVRRPALGKMIAAEQRVGSHAYFASSKHEETRRGLAQCEIQWKCLPLPEARTIRVALAEGFGEACNVECNPCVAQQFEKIAQPQHLVVTPGTFSMLS
jgi:hypothetical protein